jgi:hypothetical protein
MKPYRKRPVAVEASDPITAQNMSEIAAWCNGAIRSPSGTDTEVGSLGIVIPNQAGNLQAELGDRIIRGVQGEFYPIKPAIFDATYEEP